VNHEELLACWKRCIKIIKTQRVKCTYLLTYLPAMGFPLNVGGKLELRLNSGRSIEHHHQRLHQQHVGKDA
jgi:hypothetical protein